MVEWIAAAGAGIDTINRLIKTFSGKKLRNKVQEYYSDEVLSKMMQILYEKGGIDSVNRVINNTNAHKKVAKDNPLRHTNVSILNIPNI